MHRFHRTFVSNPLTAYAVEIESLAQGLVGTLDACFCRLAQFLQSLRCGAQGMSEDGTTTASRGHFGCPRPRSWHINRDNEKNLSASMGSALTGSSGPREPEFCWPRRFRTAWTHFGHSRWASESMPCPPNLISPMPRTTNRVKTRASLVAGNALGC